MDHSIWLIILLVARTCIGSPTMYGEITFYHSPQGYPNNVQKSWLISVPKGFGIKLIFLHLDIEPSKACDHDSVQLIIGDEVKEKLCDFQTFWSSDINLRTKYFSTNLLTVNFTSDESNMDKYTGFLLTFTAVDVNECKDSSKNNCSHVCNNYIGGYFCSCQSGYFLLPDTHTCEVVDCGAPYEIPNGRPAFSKTTFRSNTTYICVSEHYQIVLPASGDGTFWCSSKGFWVGKNGNQDPPKCTPVCGTYTLAAGSGGRIFGGKKATLGQFPWQIAFVSPNRGAGALISERWVMTAAHVVQEIDQPEMYGGLVYLPSRTDAHLLKAKKVIIHPKWVIEPLETRVNYDNDIALIHLCSRVQLGPNISPVCLSSGTSPEFLDAGYVAGWGRTEKKRKSGDLMFTEIPLQKMEKCQEIDTKKKYTFSSNMLCAGDGAGHDSCDGDSGGPLTFHDHNNNEKMYMAGIVSWGVECGKYGVYTKVENYLDWIKETIEKVESEEGEGTGADCR